MDLIDVRNRLNNGESIYDIPLMVTYYARVSTDNDEQLHSLNAQVNYFEDFIKKNSKWTFVSGYIDEGISGTSVNKRDAFLKMIDDAKLGKFDLIITKEISRFSRNTLDSIKYTQELLNDGVGVFFQSDSINTLLPDSELRLTIMASMAQEEVRRLSERVKFGIRQSTKSGVVWGTNNILGYTKDKGKLIINEKEAEIVRMVFDLYAFKNYGMRKICKTLTEKGIYNILGNPYNPRSIRGFLSNPKYKGYYVGNKSQKYDYKSDKRKYHSEDEWVMYKDEENVPPIISEEIWDRANAILNKRSKEAIEQGVAPTNRYAYSGKIICTEHNEYYYRKLAYCGQNKKEFWKCSKALLFGASACDYPILYKSELDEVIKNVCETFISNKSEITKELAAIYMEVLDNSTHDTDIAKLKIELPKIEVKKDKLLELSIEGRLSNEEFEKRNNNLNAEIERIKESIKEIKYQKESAKQMKHTLEYFEKMIDSSFNFDSDFSNEFLDGIVDRIEVYKGEDKNKFNLKVFLRLFSDGLICEIEKGKKRSNSKLAKCEIQLPWALKR